MAYSSNAYQLNLKNREKRKAAFKVADTAVKDIRLYFTYDVPPEFHYLYNFADIVGRILNHKNFLTPGYSHLYISVGETEEEAIARAIEVEDFYAFGIAVLSQKALFDAPADKLESLMLKVIADGLHDIAMLDKLDKTKIDEAIEQAAKWGVVHERVLKERENRKFLFRVSAKPIPRKKEEEIFFTLIDREDQQEYKWKFGELSIWDAAPWFFKINVTNKLIRTAPAANMQLVLAGKRLELEMSVEKIKDGTGLLRLEDTLLPIDPKAREANRLLEIDMDARRGISGMIFAAGLGTRFKPWTDKHPKALAAINGKSLLQHNVEYFQKYGIWRVTVNVHHFADQVEQTIKDNNGWQSHILISDERKELLETGGGLKLAKKYFLSPTIVVINSDILTDLDLGKMIAAHQQSKALATLAVTGRETSRYFLFNEENILCGWRNIKTGEEKIARKAGKYIQKAFSGIHVIQQQELIPLIKREGKFSMVDAYLDLASTHDILAFDHTGSKFIDVGRPEAVAAAEKLFF